MLDAWQESTAAAEWLCSVELQLAAVRSRPSIHRRRRNCLNWRDSGAKELRHAQPMLPVDAHNQRKRAAEGACNCSNDE